MERCIHSTLTSRVVLHIRMQASQTSPTFREDVVDEFDMFNLDEFDNLDDLSQPGIEFTHIRLTAVSRSQRSQPPYLAPFCNAILMFSQPTFVLLQLLNLALALLSLLLSYSCPYLY